MLIFYADKIMVMGNSENSSVLNIAILLKSHKSLKLDAHEILVFYSSDSVTGPAVTLGHSMID